MLFAKVNRDDDLASAEDYLHVAQWSSAALEHKLVEFSSTEAMRSIGADERCKTFDLLSWLLQPRPEDRPQSFGEILGHVFFDTGHFWRMSSLHVEVACCESSFKLSEVNADALDSTQHPLGATPLHIAVIDNKPSVVKSLIHFKANANATDFSQRTPIQRLLSQLLTPPSDADGRNRQLEMLSVLAEHTKCSNEIITDASAWQADYCEHLSRADHLVDACKEVRGTKWGEPLAQLLLQQSAELSWLDACRKLVEMGAKLDKPSPWDARPPRGIGMASNLPQLRDFFQQWGTVSRVALKAVEFI